MNNEKIVLNLQKLSDALVASKNPSNKYIALLIKKICAPGISEKAIDEVLQQIKSGSKIIDYANFNREQEIMWMQIWKDATDMLKNKGLT